VAAAHAGAGLRPDADAPAVAHVEEFLVGPVVDDLGVAYTSPWWLVA
jgi:hypothetical protein